MGESGDGRSVEPLIAALGDDAGCVRRAALGALRRMERAGNLPEGVWERVESLLEKRLYFFDRQEVTVPDFACDGFVLDIGGGGEGVIGALKGEAVISIDPNRRELEEAAAGPLKIVMDAKDLMFLDGSFSTVTSFFTLMYIGDQDHGQVFSEVARVLVRGGRFLIWDVILPECLDDDKDLAVFPLLVRIPGGEVETGYGVPWPKQHRGLTYYTDLAEHGGFEVIAQREEGHVLSLELRKP